MKLQFSATQDYQLQAVKSVVNIFEGQPLAQSNFETSLMMEGSSIAFTEKGIGNKLVLSEEQILQNIQAIQAENNIKISEKLEGLFPSLNPTPSPLIPNFTIEMETGTGKTYTFLRTIYELNKVYGFKKFVIVVPSVAIREGTIKNLQITNEHFQNLYDHQPINYVMYDRGNLTALRNFATSNAIQILVINVDSFTKENNVINQGRDTMQGTKPIECIQATNPIVIIDEPQNFETDIRKQAIANLNPLCTLRYSATHKNLYNLVYSLNPVQAYDLGLVKQIEVDGISTDSNYNAAFIQFKKVEVGKKNLKAKLSIYVNENGSVKQKDLSVNVGEDLFELSNGRDIYKDGYLINNISLSEGTIEFANGKIVKKGETQGGLNDEVMKYQIERTVKWHFEKLKRNKGIKILSLFFIDKVANYRSYDTEGNFEKGKFAIWFEEIFVKYQKQYADLIPFETEAVHNGYFSSDKTGKGKDKKEVWADTKGTTAKDDDTYSLIMKDKERLLSLEEPLQFIFSHSALREGWDNPNVFQICTLNESKSELKKRQEIGRGLRLPVDSEGQRIYDKNINILTVIANETYEDFSKALQNEIQEETSVEFKDRIKNTRDKVKLQVSKELTIENFPLLFDIWEKISHQTRYSVDYSIYDLISKAVAEIQKMPTIKRPMLERKTARLNYEEQGITNTEINAVMKRIEEVRYQIPDVYGYIQNKIDITRNTIYKILTQSDRLGDLEINPQLFLDNVVTIIKSTLRALLVDGVKYEQINGKKYEMTLFDYKEVETYLSNVFPKKGDNTKPLSKTFLEAVPFEENHKKEKTYKQEEAFLCVPIDSGTESQFAKDCELDDNIKFFFKLPRGFKVPTPIGDYIPDWAVIMQEDGKNKIYFVAETKSTLDKDLLRNVEQMKIECGEKHFALFKNLGVEYKKVVVKNDLYSS